MKCLICKNGETYPGETTVTLEPKGAVVVVRQVPADVCANCGEAYVSEKIARTLGDIAAETVRTGAQVEVRRFAA